MAWRYYEVKVENKRYYYRPTNLVCNSIKEAFIKVKDYLAIQEDPISKWTEPDGIDLYCIRSLEDYEEYFFFGLREE
jgi:hypothetical protein